MNLQRARVALVHDWLNQLGGAENVLEELVQMLPQAPIYTSMYAAGLMPDTYRNWDIRTSFMQNLPAVATQHQRYLPLYPAAFRRMNLSDFDLVLSNKSGFCHAVTTRAAGHRAIHVCYCLTPARFLWLYDQYREREQINALVNGGLQPILAWLRKVDRQAAQQVDRFIAISTTVQQRIHDIYNRESIVIHPPVDTEYFTPGEHAVNENDKFAGAFCIVSRLIPYKRIDLAIEAFRNLPAERLVIVGEGRDLDSLRQSASPNVTFLGRQSRSRIRELLRCCKAFIFPGLEDFGIAPVEALSCGRPVIAFGCGGALDTVEPGVSGELFSPQTARALHAVLRDFQPQRYPVASLPCAGRKV